MTEFNIAVMQSAGNEDFNTLQSVASLCDQEHIILCSGSTNNPLWYKHLVKTGHNSASSYNAVIAKARENGAKYLVVVEDNIAITQKYLLPLYFEMLEKSGAGLVINGFTHPMNLGINENPNPRIRLVVEPEEGTKPAKTVIFNETYDKGLFIIDLSANSVQFNEKLDILEFQEYVIQCANQVLIPFNNCFMDVDNSWEAIEWLLKPETEIDPEKQEEEIQKLAQVKHPGASIGDVANWTKLRFVAQQQKTWRML